MHLKCFHECDQLKECNPRGLKSISNAAGTPLEISKRRFVVPILYGQTVVWAGQIFFMCKQLPETSLTGCQCRIATRLSFLHICQLSKTFQQGACMRAFRSACCLTKTADSESQLEGYVKGLHWCSVRDCGGGKPAPQLRQRQRADTGAAHCFSYGVEYLDFQHHPLVRHCWHPCLISYVRKPCSTSGTSLLSLIAAILMS